jgi:CubicO group peptidase (beta-lactamase class C family)
VIIRHLPNQGAVMTRMIAAALSYLLLSEFTFAAAPASPERMDEIAKYYVGTKQFSGAVLVARGDKVLFSKAYEFANLEWRVPNTTTTKFRIGSVTKQFTAAAVLLLEERGRLKLDDLIKTYFPEAPAVWQNVTLAQLLSHTSGISNYTDGTDMVKFSARRMTPTDIVNSVRDRPLDFLPGEQMRYSNTGYVLLGIAIEKASGMTYEKFLQENFWTPLGMKDTGYDHHATLLPQRASGYARGPDGLQNSFYTDMSTPFSAGGLYSTVGDLLIWERSLFGKKVLSDASLQKMTTPNKGDYGFGLFIHTAGGHKVIEHSGGISGFNSHLTYFPDEQVVVVALSNMSGGADQVAGKLSSLALGEKVTLPSEMKSVAVPKSVLEKYVGTYQIAPQFNIWFTIDGAQLVSQASGQPKFPLGAESDTVFYTTAFESQLEFQKDASGKVTGVELRQNGRTVVAPRISDLAPPE